MTQRIRIENLEDGGPYTVTARVLENGELQETTELKPGESEEFYIYGDRTIEIEEVEE